VYLACIAVCFWLTSQFADGSPNDSSMQSLVLDVRFYRLIGFAYELQRVFEGSAFGHSSLDSSSRASQQVRSASPSDTAAASASKSRRVGRSGRKMKKKTAKISKSREQELEGAKEKSALVFRVGFTILVARFTHG